MKLIRFGPAGAEKPGILAKDGARVDASAWIERLPVIRRFRREVLGQRRAKG